MHVNKPDFFKLITPEMREVVEHIKQWNEEHPPTADWRQDYIDERAFWNQGGPSPAKVVEEKLEGPYGAIPVRLHYPDAGEPKGMTVFLHGGSFALGNNDTHSRIMRILSEESDTVVIGVDYRLAPENRFPTQLMEAVTVIRYFHENGRKYGLNPDDISIAGDSAGGWMALSAALYLRDNDDPRLSFLNSLLLYYGGYGMFDSPSYRLYGNEYDGMMREADDFPFWPKSLIDEKDLNSPYYDLLYNDLTHDIPPCFICSGTVDPMLDNSVTLYEILRDKGMPCELKLYPGVMHSFLHYSRIMNASKEALHLGGQFVRRNKK